MNVIMIIKNSHGVMIGMTRCTDKSKDLNQLSKRSVFRFYQLTNYIYYVLTFIHSQ